MQSFQQMFERYKRGPSEVVGLDIREASVNAVRMRRGSDRPTLVAADVLPLAKGMDVAGDLWRSVLQATGQPRW